MYIQEGVLGQFFQTQGRVPIPQPCQLQVEEVDLVSDVCEGGGGYVVYGNCNQAIISSKSA